MNRHWLWISTVLALSACGPMADVTRQWTTEPTRNIPMPDGPPIEDVVTAFDEALSCLRGKIRPEVIFAVGSVVDHTGKENFSEGGSGKFVSQGAGEMVQSALYQAGVSVVNRRDPNIAIVESNWGIRDIKRQVPVNFYISGSINSLDFIPGGGTDINIAGIGPRYRQNRILIGLDLTMTDAYTGRVIASVPLQKQIFAREVGFSAGRFFGETLVTMDAGGMEREAVHFALRQMLSLATFELLGQIMSPAIYAPCRSKVEGFAGRISHHGTANREAMAAAMRATETARADALLVEPRDGRPQPAPAPAAVAGQAGPPAAPPVVPAMTKEQMAQKFASGAVSAAVRSITLSRESVAAPSRREAVQKSAEALRLANLSLETLKRAAAVGINGDEGDAAAVVVQQAVENARNAATAATTREPDEPVPPAAPSAPVLPGPASAPAGTAPQTGPDNAALTLQPAPGEAAVTRQPTQDGATLAPAASPATQTAATADPLPAPGTPAHQRRFGQ